MKTRIISGLVGIVILFAVLLCPWTWVFTLAASLLAAMAVWELLHNTGLVKNLVTVIGSMAFSVVSVWIGRLAQVHATAVLTTVPPTTSAPADLLYPLLGIWLAVYGVFALIVFAVYKQSFVWKGFGLTVYATLGFTALTMLREMPRGGLPFALLPMVIAWMSDTGAYFVGTFFGKHKMAPVISPKKSWEGFFGGWVISIGLTAVFGVICNAFIPGIASWRFEVGLFAILAAVLAPLSVVGDLLASVIKRRCDIKDYGCIMPGHGGVMDRFDSVIFIAPMAYIVLMLFH